MESESSHTTWEHDDSHLGAPSAPEQSKTLLIDCFLYWTGCIYQTESVADWRAHCTKHLDGMRLPSAIECSFCHDFTATSTGTSSAWDLTLDHILQSHGAGSQRNTVRRSINSCREILGMLKMYGLSGMSRGDPFNLTGVRSAIPDFEDGDIDTFMQSAGTSPTLQGINLREQAPKAER